MPRIKAALLPPPPWWGRVGERGTAPRRQTGYRPALSLQASVWSGAVTDLAIQVGAEGVEHESGSVPIASVPIPEDLLGTVGGEETFRPAQQGLGIRLEQAVE